MAPHIHTRDFPKNTTNVARRQGIVPIAGASAYMHLHRSDGAYDGYMEVPLQGPVDVSETMAAGRTMQSPSGVDAAGDWD